MPSVLAGHFSLLAVLPMESLARKEPGEAVPAAPGWVISPWKARAAVSSFLGLSQPPRHGVRLRAQRTAAGLAVSRSLHHCRLQGVQDAFQVQGKYFTGKFQ